MQYLRWANFECFENDPSTTIYKCEKCNYHIPHTKKRWMVERGEWRATAPYNGKHAGFHIWAAYSYSPNATWQNLMEEYLACKDDQEQLKAKKKLVIPDDLEERMSRAVKRVFRG